eukprot:TRINITY_DN4579_c3_g5_i1.p1 TRINITY_DN4579_c3_g5~~TRINITY_DN4579_c3_g5_i1.p1  ORF type:complete len:375 (+),score=42.87 TRINITY_DN4579_c3_g5_i1:62-1126(+)
MASTSPQERWKLRAHLAHFICFVNELQPLYPLLEINNLSTGVLNSIVHRCSMTTSPHEPIPELTSNGQFLSHFLIRNCGNYLRKDPRGTQSPREESVSETLDSAAYRPVHLVLNRTQLGARAPRWVWDPEIYTKGVWQYANIVQDIFGKEHELGRYRLFMQGQSSVSMEHPRWRRLDLQEVDHMLRDVLRFKPGLAWINAEVWAAPKGKDTSFHYDYDSHVHLFQVVGSRRFHIFPPQSSQLEWAPMKDPNDRPIDYGTRWAEPKGSEGEIIVDTQPGSVLKIPNGWPHKVVYKERSIGFRVASWTQCQAISMWLGQRLCLLSTKLGHRRICFDDEDHREHGGYKKLEQGGTLD